jgi:uncharacterized protein with HEPN domain
VLCCQLPQTIQHRRLLLANLSTQLRKIQTPLPVIAGIMKGFKDWEEKPSGRSRAHTYGSLLGPDILLTSAYYEQFYQLGWFQLCLGRISHQWSQAVVAYHLHTCPTFDDVRWATSFISLLWKFTQDLWKTRNQLVHEKTVEETVAIQLSVIHEKVTSLYRQYTEQPYYVLPWHEYLFTQRFLHYRLGMSYDSIKCWIRSVEEARHILEFQQKHLQEDGRDSFQMLATSIPYTKYTTR